MKYTRLIYGAYKETIDSERRVWFDTRRRQCISEVDSRIKE